MKRWGNRERRRGSRGDAREGSDHPMLQGLDDRLGLGMDLEFLVDLLDMAVHRVETDEELARDLLIARTGDEVLEDLPFPGRKIRFGRGGRGDRRKEREHLP